MILPKNETRIFDHELLDNGIKIIYVEDPLLDKTIVSVTVAVGSFANPKEYQGLAHFLEHMLFHGSKKYPDENAFPKAIEKYGGHTNAYTSHFETVYYFSAFNNGITDAMEIFSRFFIDPLFNEDAVNREINAVNSEHQKNINSDHWREYQLIKNISKIDSAHNTFPTGNLETLKKEGVREKMIEFYQKYYVSENLCVCMVSNLKIDKQKKMIKKTFGKIPKQNKETFTLIKPIFETESKTYQMIPLSDIQQLNYYWEIPNDKKFMRNKLFIILGDVLVKNDKNSYLNYLKINGYVQEMHTSIHEKEGTFSINFTLTKLGLKNINFIDGTLKHELDKIFKYDWKKIVNYYKKLYLINFENSSKIDSLSLANKLSVNLHNYNFNEVFVGEHIILNPTSNIELIKPYFLKNHLKILVLNSKLDDYVIDPYYGTKYAEIKNIDFDLIKINNKLNLDNPFLDMKPYHINNLDCEKPTLIKEKSWYGGSSEFNESIMKGSLIFESPKFFNSPKNYLLTILVDSCLTFYLKQELYNILTLNFDISILSKHKYNALIIEYSCPNDPIKFNQFINKTLYLIQTATIPPKIMEEKIQHLKEELANTNHLNPWEYSSYYISQKESYLNTVLLKEIDKITNRDIKLFINEIFDDCTLTTFFYGNLTQDQIPQNDIMNRLIFNQRVPFKKINFIENITINHPNLNEKNNCVTYYFYIGAFSPLNWLHLFIVNLILDRIFYQELRTKKQMGYLVNLGMTNYGDNYYLFEKIQSNKSCDEICNEINKFNSKIEDFINDNNLEATKISCKNHLKEKSTSIDDCFNKYFNEILTRKYLFDRKKIILQQLKNVTKDSIKNFTKEYIFENTYKSIFRLKGN